MLPQYDLCSHLFTSTNKNLALKGLKEEFLYGLMRLSSEFMSEMSCEKWKDVRVLELLSVFPK